MRKINKAEEQCAGGSSGRNLFRLGGVAGRRGSSENQDGDGPAGDSVWGVTSAAQRSSREAVGAGAVSEGSSRESGVQLPRSELEDGGALSWV